jgi:hypothetical protein
MTGQDPMQIVELIIECQTPQNLCNMKRENVNRTVLLRYKNDFHVNKLYSLATNTIKAEDVFLTT